MSCLDNLIGFTLDDCICFKGEFTQRSRISKSGLYIDDLAEFPSLKSFESILGCDQILEDAFLEAEKTAKQSFKTKLFKELSNLYTSNNKFGQLTKVGNTNQTALIDVNSGKVALAYQMQPLKGMKLEIKQVLPFFNQSRQLEITIIKAYSSNATYDYIDEVGKFTINTVGSQNLELPYNLPFTDEQGQPFTYLFVYDITDGLKPKNNANTCNCGTSETELHRQLYPRMTMGTDVFNLPIAKMSNIAGLLFYIESVCHSDDIICANYKKSSLVASGIDVWFQNQIAKNMITKILHSDVINRMTMSNSEMLFNQTNILYKKNQANMKYIAQNIDVSNSSCWQCRPTNKSNPYYMEKTGIRM